MKVIRTSVFGLVLAVTAVGTATSAPRIDTSLCKLSNETCETPGLRTCAASYEFKVAVPPETVCGCSPREIALGNGRVKCHVRTKKFSVR